MARQLTPLGRFLFVVAGVALLGYGLYKYGVLARLTSVLAPEKRQEGTVSRDDFGSGSAGGGTASATSTGAGGSAPVGGGPRLKRPIKAAIVPWGGHAGGILANGGMLPNPASAFSKDFGVQVEMPPIAACAQSRDACR